jgi:hypothetical protein
MLAKAPEHAPQKKPGGSKPPGSKCVTGLGHLTNTDMVALTVCPAAP